MDSRNEKVDSQQERQKFLEPTCDSLSDEATLRDQVDSFFEAGYSNNNVTGEPKNLIAYQSLNDIAIHYTKPQDIIHASNSSSSTSLSFNDPATNRQEYDRRLSVFLGTTRPFQRRRTQEEQEIENNFRWSMCLRHRHTLIFFACIVVFVVGIVVSLALKK